MESLPNMISSSSDSCSKLVAGKYDVLLDDNQAPTRQALNRYLERFSQLEFEQQQQQDEQTPDCSGYSREFKQLRELSKTLKIDKDNLRDGELECNLRKNRYQDIIPFNHTRVVLNSLPDSPGSDYINANFIRGSSGSPRAYIACQGPLKRTLSDFWRMIWESNVSVVIMACNEYESGQLKCEPYWPELQNTSCLYGNFEVSLMKVRQICDDFLIRKLSVKLLKMNNHHHHHQSSVTINTETATDSSSASSCDDGDGGRITRSDGDSDSFHPTSSTPDQTHKQQTVIQDNYTVLEERTICQFHYTTWPDHGVPASVHPILELLRLVRDVQPAEDKPILVHCSAGCGRTGTICCIDYVWGLLRRCRLEPDFDLYHVISEMRRQRMSMVQTLEQYILCHRAVAALFADQLSTMLDMQGDALELDVAQANNQQQQEPSQHPDEKASDDEEEEDGDDDEDYGPVFI